MDKRLRTVLDSTPLRVAAGLFAIYLLAGFFALPAIVKWQLEKQVSEKLGHGISIAEVRFNPLNFRFEVEGLALADPQGRPMVGFRRLLVDFELRSIIDRAWTFAEARLEAPSLRFELGLAGRHNFSELLDRLANDTPDEETGSLPRFVVQKISLSDGDIEYADSLLAEPVIAHVVPLQIAIENLSSLPSESAQFRISARSAEGETLDASGALGLNPIASSGKLGVRDFKVETLARGLARLLALDSPTGTLSLGGDFDLAVEGDGALSGGVRQIGLALSGLSLREPGGESVLLALETLALDGGHLDLGKHEVVFAGLRMNKGSVRAATDAAGSLNWSKLVRAADAESQDGDAAPAVAAEPAPAAPPAAWRVAVDKVELSEIALAFDDQAGGQQAALAALGLKMSPSAEFGPAGTRIELAGTRLSLAEGRFSRGKDGLTLPEAVVAASTVSIALEEPGLALALVEPSLTAARGFTARQAAASLALSGLEIGSGRIELSSAGAAMSGAADTPKLALAGIAAGDGTQQAKLQRLALGGKRLTLDSRPEGLEVVFDGATTELATLALRRGEDGLTLGAAKVANAALSMAQSEGRMKLTAKDTQLTVKGLDARQAEQRIQLADGGLRARQSIVSVAADSPDGTTVRVADAALELGALSLVAKGSADPLGAVGSARLTAGSLLLSLAEGPPDLVGEQLGLDLSDTLLRSLADGSELLRLGSATLAGGKLGLKARSISADSLSLGNGKAETWIDEQGRLNWLHAFADSSEAPPQAVAGSAGTADEPAGPAWRIAVGTTSLDDVVLGFEDRRSAPAFALALEANSLKVSNLDTGASTPMQIDLKSRLASGGQINASGSVRADTGATDLKLALGGVELAPVQPYLSQFAALQFASGTVSSDGRLRYGDETGAAAKLRYEGTLSLASLLLEELEPKRPFISWEAVATDELTLTLEPNGLEIGELRITHPVGRLIIAEDQSINLSDVLKKQADEPAPDEATPSQPSAAPEVQTEAATDEDPFPVSISRIKLAQGELDFADLSLRPQFGARMHDLKGIISGLATDPNRAAKIQLDAQVNKFGSARIGGQISVLKPERLTEIDMSFRNIDMTSLSPYVVKFAGYRVAAGRLSLDLQYRIKDSKMVGTNKVVLNQMALGEKVDSPDALDLPLELAIAILKDSKGVIDIGVPVSGAIDDPQFDYGTVIGKAIGNLLGSIVTAPFRALGALFGAADKKLDTIDFEPGSATLAPPERQKLETVARALKERPALTLTVPPVYATEPDTLALKSLTVRSDVTRRMGIELAAGEDPGPVDAANPRARQAIEQAFSARYAPEVFAALKSRALAEPAASSPASTAPAAGPESPAAVAPPGPGTAFYQDLLERLIRDEPISEEMLAALATRRSEAIIAELTTSGGVPPTQVQAGKVGQAAEGSDKAVGLKLELEAAK